jgi:hypothetical protein
MGSIADTTGVPSPGSEEAIDQGCICPVLDNHYGRGFYIPGEPNVTYFLYTMGCPLHKATTADDA